MNSSLPRWSKGGVPISEANGDSLEVTVDYSYFTDPVSCEVSNSVGSTNVSTLVDVQCKSSSASEKFLLCFWDSNEFEMYCFHFVFCLNRVSSLCLFLTPYHLDYIVTLVCSGLQGTCSGLEFFEKSYTTIG